MKNGGPAFPTRWEPHMDTDTPTEGMSLRDYFAAEALAAIIVRSTNHAGAIMPRYGNGFPIDRTDFTNTAYQYADAMLAERAK